MTTATGAWPTTAEIASAQAKVMEAHSALDRLSVHLGVYKREKLDAEEWASLPSLEGIGEVTRFLAFAEYDVVAMRKLLESIASVQRRAAWMSGEREERDDAS